jgi:hypothetical protein
MTEMEWLRGQLEDNLRRHGEDALSTRMLRQQIAALEKGANMPAQPLFLIGARGKDSAEVRRNPLDEA